MIIWLAYRFYAWVWGYPVGYPDDAFIAIPSLAVDVIVAILAIRGFHYQWSMYVYWKRYGRAGS